MSTQDTQTLLDQLVQARQRISVLEAELRRYQGRPATDAPHLSGEPGDYRVTLPAEDVWTHDHHSREAGVL